MIIIGLVCNLLGAIVLAVSTGKFFYWIVLSIKAHDVYIQSQCSNHDILRVEGVAGGISESFKKCKFPMLVGIVLMIIGFIFQLIDVLITSGS